MATLASKFTPIPNPYLQSGVAPSFANMIELAAGKSVTFGPDDRFALPSEGTLIIEFSPFWLAWTDPGTPVSHPCIVQIGTDDDPGAVVRIAVTRELDAILISSKATPDPVRYAGDCAGLRRLFIFFSPLGVVARMWGKLGMGSLDGKSHRFSLGTVDAGEKVSVRMGEDAGPTAAPFGGFVGRMMLFDRNLDADFQAKFNPDLVEQWCASKIDSFHKALTNPSQQKLARSLFAVFYPPEARTDFVPREILAPDPAGGSRWVVESGDHPSKRVVLDANPKATHGIHSSFNVFTFVRDGDTPCLWGDSGQRFTLDYAGKGVFQAAGSAPGKALKATIAYTDADRIEIRPDGWANATEKLFATRTFPAGSHLDRAQPADLWPTKPALVRVPTDYDLTRNQSAPVKQDMGFKAAFSLRLKQIGTFSHGWDVTELGLMNPGASGGAQFDEQYYLFKQPDDNSPYYRLDQIATPYYCFSATPDFSIDNNGTTLYRTSSEASAAESNSLGFDIGIAGQKLLSLGTNNSMEQSLSKATECMLGVHRSRTVKYVLSLDRRWATLTKNFTDAVLREADAAIAGQSDPEPYHKLFVDFGTHYANAITYGSQSGEITIVDEQIIKSSLKTGKGIKGSIELPVDDATIGVNAGHDDTKGSGNEAQVKTENRSSIRVGSDADPLPILLDLRPVLDLLQPPYINDERVRRTAAQARAAWQRYTKGGTSAPTWESPVFVQARMILMRNLTNENLYVVGRAFAVGTKSGSDWDIVIPRTAAERQSGTLLWGSTAGAKFELPPLFAAGIAGAVVTLALPRSGVDFAIGWTGVTTVTHDAAIAAIISDAKTAALGSQIHARGFIPKREHATPADIQARIDQLLAGAPALAANGVDWIGFDANGAALAQNAAIQTKTVNGTECNRAVFREKLKFATLANSATFTNATLKTDMVEITFQVRKFDPMDLLDDTAAAQFKL